MKRNTPKLQDGAALANEILSTLTTEPVSRSQILTVLGRTVDPQVFVFCMNTLVEAKQVIRTGAKRGARYQRA